jgi:predicted nuclease with TOPRIM domain
MNNSKTMFAVLSTIGLMSLLLITSTTDAQEKQDPTAPSTVIEQTLSKIRDVEKLDTFVQQNATLVQENKKLKAEIASIQKQIAKLSKDLELQTVNLRKQLLQMPTFNVQSKIINGNRSAAILKSKNTIIRIRNNTQLSVPVSDGVWVLMQVKNISKEMIELYFPELERTVYLYD